MKYFAYLFSFFLLFSCKKKDTSWNVDLEAPLLHDTLSLKNWVNDSTLANVNGEIQVNVTRNLLDIGLSDLIKIPDTSITQLFSPVITLSNIPPGTTFVNTIEEHAVDLDDILLKTIRVFSGRVKVKVFNPLGTKVNFKVQLPGVTLNGQPFEQNYSVDAGTIANPTIQEEWLDLSHYQIDLRGLSGLDHNILQSKLSLTTDPNGAAISISSAYDFKFEASLEHVKIDYAKGYFGNKIVADTSTFMIDFMNKISQGTLDLPETSLQLSIENGFKVPIRGQIHSLKNVNQLGNEIALVSPEIGPSVYLSPASGAWSNLQANMTQLSFDSSNSNIDVYLENLGNQHQAAYEVQLNPWGNTSAGNDEAFPNSRLRVKASAQLPLKLGLDGLTLKDTFDIHFKQQNENTHLESGIIQLEVTNAFPFSCDPTIYFLNEAGHIAFSVVGTSQISSCELGSIDPFDGLKKKVSHIEFALDEELVSQLSHLPKVIVEARFDSPNPATGQSEQKQVQANAFLSFKLRLKLKTKLVI